MFGRDSYFITFAFVINTKENLEMKKIYLMLTLLSLFIVARGTNVITWATTDKLFEKDASPKVKVMNTIKLTAWKGERIHARILTMLDNESGEMSFTVNQPDGKEWMDSSTTGFVNYVLTDGLLSEKSGCGHRTSLADYDSSLVADYITPNRVMEYKAGSVQPIWITFDIPTSAKAGVYKGNVAISLNKKVVKRLDYSIKVINRELTEQGKQTFHLDLWQNPFAVARIANVQPWSDEHFKAMRPIMTRLAKAGQKGITTSITHKPWNGQTYDYFENMITEVKRIDGSFVYDYSVFDKYVDFMLSCGVGPYIYCYSVIPWEMSFRYYDQATNKMVDQKMKAGSDEFNAYWTGKLSAFAKHLKEKGWFDNTIIAMDERPKESMLAALKVIRDADKDFKISLAGTYHKELDDEIFDYCIGYNDMFPEGVIKARDAKGKITTYYTCCTETFPNSFSFSQPIEAKALPIVSAQRELKGYLRWAYNSWVKNPYEDTRFTSWSGGDTFIVYPMNSSSVRFEKLIEGIQMYEKMQILNKEKGNEKKIKNLLKPFAHDKLNKENIQSSVDALESFLNR